MGFQRRMADVLRLEMLVYDKIRFPETLFYIPEIKADLKRDISFCMIGPAAA